MKNLKVVNNEDSCCSKCGEDSCCHNVAGSYHPSQFVDNWDRLKKLLDEERVVLLGDPDKVFLIKPRQSGDDLRLENLNHYWGFPLKCVNLTKDGCSFAFDERPLECQRLIPDKVNGCYFSEKEDYPLEWMKYKDIVKDIFKDTPVFWMEKIPDIDMSFDLIEKALIPSNDIRVSRGVDVVGKPALLLGNIYCTITYNEIMRRWEIRINNYSESFYSIWDSNIMKRLYNEFKIRVKDPGEVLGE